jgi:hypothetical protein
MLGSGSVTREGVTAPSLLVTHLDEIPREFLGFNRDKQLDGAPRIALKVTIGYWRRDDRHEWTDAGREDFSGAEVPEAINVEVTIIGARKWRSVAVYEYRQPQGETGPGHHTP